MTQNNHTNEQYKRTIDNLNILRAYVSDELTDFDIHMEHYFAISKRFNEHFPDDYEPEHCLDIKLDEDDSYENATHNTTHNDYYIDHVKAVGRVSKCGAVACMLGHSYMALRAVAYLKEAYERGVYIETFGRMAFPLFYDTSKNAYRNDYWLRVFGTELSPLKEDCLERIEGMIEKLSGEMPNV